jgi:hypothetical protein
LATTQETVTPDRMEVRMVATSYRFLEALEQKALA